MMQLHNTTMQQPRAVQLQQRATQVTSRLFFELWNASLETERPLQKLKLLCLSVLLPLQVSPTERALLLTTSASLHAAKTTQHNQCLSTVLSTQQLGTRPLSARPLQPPAATAVGNRSTCAASDSLQEAATAADNQFTCGASESLRKACAEDTPVEDVTEGDDDEAAAAMPTAAVAAAMAAEQGAAQEQQPLQSMQNDQDPGAQDRSHTRRQQEQQETAGPRTQHDHHQQQQHDQQQQQQQQQQRRLSMTLQGQGSLRDAALTCGIDMPVDATARIFAPAAASGNQQAPSASRCLSAAGAAAEDAQDGVPEVRGVFISDADVDEYLQVEKARLTAR
jgi:hypothetical protein